MIDQPTRVHAFVTWAPGYETPVEVEHGEVVQRGDFVYADLLPVGAAADARAAPGASPR